MNTVPQMRRPPHWPHCWMACQVRRCAQSICVLALLTLFGTIATAAPAVKVTRLEWVSQTRVDRYQYDYAYRVFVFNAGTAASDVSAIVSGTPEGVTALVSGTYVGAVPAGTELAGQTLVRLRHDRRLPFSDSQIKWLLHSQDGTFTGLLAGGANQLAVSQTFNYAQVGTAPPLYLSVEAGNRVAADELILVIAAGATVGDLNAALTAHGARIGSMSAGSSIFSIVVPRAMTLASLEATRASLATRRGIASARLSPDLARTTLPPNSAFADPVSEDFIGNSSFTLGGSNRIIDHHLAIRSAAVWNLRDLLETKALRPYRPVLSYLDYFGDGPPDSNMNVDSISRLFGTADPDKHGYGVMSVASANYGGDLPPPLVSTPDQIATGLYPGKLTSYVIDATLYRPGAALDALKQQIVDLTGYDAHVIVSSSLGRCGDDTKATADCLRRTHAHAVDWIDRMRSSQSSFLMVAAGGNAPSHWAYETGDFSAADASIQTDPTNPLHLPGRIARVKDDGTPILDAAGNIVYIDKLSNILTVEARENIITGLAGAPFDRILPPVSGCPATYASHHGGIGGIGGAVAAVTGIPAKERAVYVLGSPGTVGSFEEGTSIATPQVAAVAAWVWSLAPQLAASDVKRIVRESAMRSPAVGCTVDDTRFGWVTDVYAAALATDNPYYNDPARSVHLGHSPIAPARMFLLDVAKPDPVSGGVLDEPDGKFTQADIYAFLREFEKRAGNSTPDYSRYDLNGNGVTGEPSVRTDVRDMSRIDLDGDLKWSSRTPLNVEGLSKDFDETFSSDIEVLIYYAFSDLYEGNAYERTMLLLPYLSTTHLTALKLDTLTISLPAPNPRITTFQLANIDAASPTFQSQCSSERGVPYFSQAVTVAASSLPPRASPAQFLRPLLQAGRLGEHVTNQTNCSSFVATIPGTGLMWINSAGRYAEAGGSPDEEYQSRFFFGEPDMAATRETGFAVTDRRRATQSMTYGVVSSPTAAFAPMFTTRNFILTARSYRLLQ